MEKRREKRLLCNYCKQSVSKSSFYQKHRDAQCINVKEVKRSELSGKNYDNEDIHEKVLPPPESQIDESTDAAPSSSQVPINVCGREDQTLNADSECQDVRSSSDDNDILFEVDVSEDEILADSIQLKEDEEEIWNIDGCNPTDDFLVPNETEPSNQAYELLSQIFRLLFVWQMTQFISDQAINGLLDIIKKVMDLINIYITSDTLQDIIDSFPASLYKARKIVGVERDCFDKHVVCPKCDETYPYADAFETKNGKIISKVCSKVEYPEHNQVRFTRPCGIKLMKTVLSGNGKRFLYPFKVYCCQSIQLSLERMLKRKGFKKLLHEGPYGTSDAGLLSDICDGNIYKTFKDGDGLPYFEDKRNIGVMLNLDWFNPFKRSEYSLGVIYLVILNLPRNHRFLWENVITLGIIPGPKEPSLTINSFLQPLVDELLQLWKGKTFDEDGCSAVYKVALLATSSDIPATRKCGGFMGHNANKGCSKCLKTFPRDAANKPDYSGYNDVWPVRDGDMHKQIGEEWKNAVNKKCREQIEFNHGVRYSELFRLPYFDPVRMHLVDPMHNLMLGIAKHTFLTWIEVGVLDEEKLKSVEQRMSLLQVPSDVGRVARNISRCYKSLKADEWKHWTLIFSMFSLRGILPPQCLNMWSLFVNACSLLCRRSITYNQLDEAHNLLKMFCISFQETFGSVYCVPNMHLSLHLHQCILDYGSVYSFWCFSFERYNGVLGRYHNNNHSITIQVMRKFIIGSKLYFDDQYSDQTDFFKALKMLYINNKSDINGPELEFSCCVNLSVFKKCTIPLHELGRIEYSLQKLYDEPVQLLHFVKKLKRVEFLGQVFARKDYRSKNISVHSRILARYPIEDMRQTSSMAVKPGVIIDIFEVVLERKENEKLIRVPIMMVKCYFFEPVEYQHFFGVNSGISLWSTETTNYHYIPMKFITGRYACVKEKIVVKQIGHLNCSDIFNVVIGLPSKSVL